MGQDMRTSSMDPAGTSPRTKKNTVLVWLLLFFGSSCCCNVCYGMFPEEAGQLDFLIATAGHGPTRFVMTVLDDDGDAILTAGATETLSPSSSSSSSCYLARRSQRTGQLQWRRNVCLNENSSESVAAVVGDGNSVVSMDSSGSVRSWNAPTGVLQWETMLVAMLPEEEKEEEQDNAVAVLSIHQSASSKTTYVNVQLAGDSNEYWLEADTGKIVADIDLTLSTELVSRKQDTNRIVCPAMEVSVPVVAGLEDLGQIQSLFLVSTTQKKDDDSCHFVVSTTRGTTAYVTLTTSTDKPSILWTAEEGLASLTGGLLLDASHFVTADNNTPKETTTTTTTTTPAVLLDPKQILSFSSRIMLQTKALQQWIRQMLYLFSKNQNEDSSFLTTGFGFEKIAVLLSDTSHRIYGMYTTGPQRTHIKYHLDLPMEAVLWHKLIHGAPNAHKTVRGIHGKSHFPRQVLVVSAMPEQVSYTCFDGTTGNVHGQGTVQIDNPVSQLVPLSLVSPSLSSSSSACRQGVILILDDLSTVVLPPEETSTAMMQMQDSSSSSGVWFAHRWRNTNTFSPSMESFRLMTTTSTTTDSKITAQLMGMAQFPEETVVQVAYPNREEVIQSPCNVLGDQSLLLKYLNPHLVVVMTTTTTAAPKDETDLFTKAFMDSTTTAAVEKKQKRKPAGVGAAPEESTTTTTTPEEPHQPNLFVNVMDTVSGRVLYRASHANAMVSVPRPTLLVSENWIFYSFVNAKTRRAELGVLSLYEGMVDPNGLTAFTAPDQSKTFSSLDARENKPVVLAKTYSLSKPITALGITTTRGGISGKKLLLATVDGSIYTVDRRVVETRRPMGQLKETEKQEGLRQYSELIPLITYTSLTYALSVEHVTQIVTAPTDLESQTIVLAIGGPDIFVTRNSPSRGFDLLPDSFSRIMLSIIVVLLIGLYLVLQRIVVTKTVQKGWM